MSRRLVTIVSGIGALVALGVMIAAVVVGPDDESGPVRASLPGLPESALTVAVQDTQLPFVSRDLIPSRIERIVSTGAQVTRVDVLWSEIAVRRPVAPRDPDDPAYTWDRYDAIIDGFAARGVQVIADVFRTPSWANGGRGPEWAPDPDDYEAFMRALAERYDGTAHAAVRMYEPWNAPNDALVLMPQWEGDATAPRPASPRIYAELLSRAYDEIKAVSSDAVVIGLSTGHVEASSPPAGNIGVVDFVQALVPLAPRMDAVAQHLQPSTAPNAPSEATPSFATLPKLVDAIEPLAPGAPLLITRLGYETPQGGLSEADQAAYLTQALQRLADVPRVRLAVWYGLQDSPERPGGLLREDGTEKPAWETFASSPKALPSAVP